MFNVQKTKIGSHGQFIWQVITSPSGSNAFNCYKARGKVSRMQDDEK